MPFSSTFDDAHTYMRPDAKASRSPCPALNALANQGYIARSGNNISFWELLYAIRHVYNLSFPLAFILTLFGFLTCGQIFYAGSEPGLCRVFGAHLAADFPWLPTWSLNLSSLSSRGFFKIAHNASLVHPDDRPSTSPDPYLLSQLVRAAHSHQIEQTDVDGLTFTGLARLHANREASSKHPPNWLHEQVALGECGLAWSMLWQPIPISHQTFLCPSRRDSLEKAHGALCAIPSSRLQQWFGEERLPDDWWNGGRPTQEVGLFEARKRAYEVGCG